MKVRELLSDPNKWTKRSMAYSEDGECVEAISPEASCWCLMGALRRCYPSVVDNFHAYQKLSNAIKTVRWDGFVVGFNDDPATTHADILKVLEIADV